MGERAAWRGVERVISGGQTGADRGGLDAAIDLGIPHGGACPRGRRAEDGQIPDRYALTELSSRDYAARTEANVREGDATLILSRGPLTGGSALTRSLAGRAGRPCLHVDLDPLDAAAAASQVRAWLERERPRVLNVAGPRESGCPGIREEVRLVLAAALG